MRLKKEVAEFITGYVKENFPGAKAFLFGSRADDKKRGGDIDVLISELSGMRISFYKLFGEQKIDLINFTYKEKTPFKEIALNQAVEL